MAAYLLALTMLFQIASSAESVTESANDKFDSPFKINSRFNSGSALIYDCKLGYLTCVDVSGLDDCKTARVNSEYKGEYRLNCAPLRMFKTRLECLKENYRVLESAGTKRFCYPK